MADFDQEKIDEVVLALLFLNGFADHGVTPAWKGFDWETMNRLHARGLISDPKSKGKSIILSEDGERLAGELFRKHFGVGE